MRQIKEAVILAGGKGTRMLPASLFTPKEMMPLVDTPVLNHLIWEAVRAGATRIHLVLSRLKLDILAPHMEKSPVNGSEVRIDLPREAVSLGIEGVELFAHLQRSSRGVADAISVALPFITGPFLVLLGDNLLMTQHKAPKYSGPSHASNASRMLVEEFIQNGLPCVGVYPVEPSELGKFGVVELDGNKIVSLVEKPAETDTLSNYVLCGRYVMPRNMQELLDKYSLSEFGEEQSIRVLHHFMENEGLVAVKLDHAKMYDSGDPVSWLKAQMEHAVLREDIGPDISVWMEKILRKIKERG